MTKFRFFSLLAAVALVACSQKGSDDSPATPAFDPSKSDPQAIQVVEQMWQALGGKTTWQKARYISFHWIVERDGHTLADYRHDWDRYTNRYRLEGIIRGGQHLVALLNLDTKDGEVYLNGQKVTTDSTLNKTLGFAYARFINDSYWLLMPYKLNDPGVILKYQGEDETEGRKSDVVQVTFEHVGLTPEDTYWAYIDKEDHLMHRWAYVLQDQPRDAEPTVAWWEDWQPFGGIKLATNRRFVNRPLRIYFDNVKVASEVDDDVFSMTEQTF